MFLEISTSGRCMIFGVGSADAELLPLVYIRQGRHQSSRSPHGIKKPRSVQLPSPYMVPLNTHPATCLRPCPYSSTTPSSRVDHHPPSAAACQYEGLLSLLVLKNRRPPSETRIESDHVFTKPSFMELLVDRISSNNNMRALIN